MKSFTRILAVLVPAGWAGSISALPLAGDDIITVDGTEWAQVDLFLRSTFEDMLAACPTGACRDA